MSITLRPATPDDLAAIHAIRRDAILGIPAEAGLSHRQSWADSRSPEFFADRVAAGHVVIASSGDDDMGWGSSAEAWITGLYVRSSWSHKGVGRIIMSALETEIRQRGHTCARLESSPNAIGFYTRLGYVPVGPPGDEGAVLMEASIQ